MSETYRNARRSDDTESGITEIPIMINPSSPAVWQIMPKSAVPTVVANGSCGPTGPCGVPTAPYSIRDNERRKSSPPVETRGGRRAKSSRQIRRDLQRRLALESWQKRGTTDSPRQVA